jgi:hypothetical protein
MRMGRQPRFDVVALPRSLAAKQSWSCSVHRLAPLLVLHPGQAGRHDQRHRPGRRHSDKQGLGGNSGEVSRFGPGEKLISDGQAQERNRIGGHRCCAHNRRRPCAEPPFLIWPAPRASTVPSNKPRSRKVIGDAKWSVDGENVRLEHFQPDWNRPTEAGTSRLIQMLCKQRPRAARPMPKSFQSG